MTCVLVGERPSKKKNKYIFKDDRIFHACQQYGELNLIEYLYLLRPQGGGGGGGGGGGVRGQF